MTDEGTVQTSDTAEIPAAPPAPGGVRGRVHTGTRKLRSGDLGSAPIIVGLLLIVAIFQYAAPTFLSSSNLVSLASQISSTGIIAVGVMLMLLLGEIDLSVGSVSGAAAAILAVGNVKNGLSPAMSIGLALGAGVIIGLLQGLIFTKFGVPSFVVTLAGLLVWQGVQRRVLASTGTVNLPRNGWLLDVGQFKYFGYLGATVIGALLVGMYLTSALAGRHRRAVMDLNTRSIGGILLRAAGIAVISTLVIYALCQDLGVPWIFVFFLAIVVLADWALRRTRYGRYVFAIGGNIEAARRSGIRVDTIRCSVFVLCSLLAATGGVVEAMRAGSAGRDTGTGDVLINAIAAAVIGGTSLFGGRTRRFAALLGILVIGAIPNGLNLLNLSDDLRFIITGSVLIAAVVVDALSRRGRQASGAG